jgi:hypothetical protein
MFRTTVAANAAAFACILLVVAPTPGQVDDETTVGRALDEAGVRYSGKPISATEFFRVGFSPAYHKELLDLHERRLREIRPVRDKEIYAIGIVGKTNWDVFLKQLPQLNNVKDLYIGAWKDNTHGKALANFSRLDSLTIYHTQLNTIGAENVAQLKSLKHLNIKGSGVNGGAMQQLANIENLETIGLGLEEEKNLKYFARYKNLKGLSLGTLITQEGAREIAKMTNLRHLGLSTAKLDLDGFKEIAKLSELQSLSLPGQTNVDDAAVEILAGKLKQLEYLDLTHTSVTDAGLAHLQGLDKLATLVLNQTKVTEKGLIKLATLKGLRKLEICRTPAMVWANGPAAKPKDVVRAQAAAKALADFRSQRPDVVIRQEMIVGPVTPGFRLMLPDLR